VAEVKINRPPAAAEMRNPGPSVCTAGDPSAGCAGLFLAVRGGTCGLCYGSARYGRPGEQIRPAAFMGSSNVWDCPNRVLAADVVGG
jgi:hypothetical protein